jgi:hypothetical protein
MAIAASSITPTNSLEDFRIEFNNLVSDVSGITATNKFTENIIFEGATADAYETTLTVTDPTADRTITLPNETGTVFMIDTSANTLITRQTSITSGNVASSSDELLLSDASATAFKRITVDNLISSAGGLTAMVSDTTPQLGGDLDVNGNDVVSVSNGNINILPNGSGVTNIDGNGSSGGVTISDGSIDVRTSTGSIAQMRFFCESSNAHAQTLKAQPHSAGSSSTLTLPASTGTLIGTGDTGTLPLAAIDIDGGTDIGAALSATDLIIVDDGAGGTNRKAALSRVTSLTDSSATALAIALG